MTFDIPPPPYSETSESPQPHHDATPLPIRRKQVTRTLNAATSSGRDIDHVTKHSQYIAENGRPEGINAAPRIASKSQSQLAPPKISAVETLQVTSTSTKIGRTVSAPATPLHSQASGDPSKVTRETSSEPPPTLSSSASSYVSKAFQEARHFAGGIIARPSESTRHFSILRHSHGLVFYQGCSTTLAISIFSDAPLPAGARYGYKTEDTPAMPGCA
ncbi:hypothetical protein EYC84_005673 [Monilinia fructicola]|uniref:Uncharacterized protein n=1 Tax=Monilinia fructicola TaxID=38448 RepID=A0A5M9JX97_MONFR|nr:hypothetical protein EYC84_005673 [Monilinia fructicola]